MPVVSPSTRATIAAALRDRGPLRIVADRRLGRVRLAGTLAVRFTLLPMQFPPPQEHNCTNRTHTYTTTTLERQVPARPLGDFAGCFAPARAVMTQQVLHPARRGPAPSLVVADAEGGACTPGLDCLV